MQKNKGQSIIEYVALAMLIIVGTIVMGPYVIRSIGAHFKLWQETVDDSVNDRMKTLPITVYEHCKVSGLQASGCGAPLKGSGKCTITPPGGTYTNTVGQQNCAPSERYWFQSGVPDGCFYCEGCEPDVPYCCSKYTACISSPCCGKRPSPGYQRKNFLPDGLSLPAVTAYGDGGVQGNDTALTPVEQSCYYGEEILYNNCDKTKVRCQINPACGPSCIGNLPVNSYGTTTAHLCTPGGNERLTQDEMISWYDPCPPPPPDKPGPDAGPHDLSVYYRADDAIELYNAALQSDGKIGICDPGTVCTTNTMPSGSGNYQNPKMSLTLGTDDYTQLNGIDSINGKFSTSSGQCDSDTNPYHLQWWQKLLGVMGLPTLGGDGSSTFYCLYWLGPLLCHATAPGIALQAVALGPIIAPSPTFAWDHGFWGCSKSDDPVDYNALDKLLDPLAIIVGAANILNWFFNYDCIPPYCEFEPFCWCGIWTEFVYWLNYSNAELLANLAVVTVSIQHPVQHPYDDHQWNNCEANGGADSCPMARTPDKSYYHKLSVKVAPGTTTYLYMRLAEDDGPPYQWISLIWTFVGILIMVETWQSLEYTGLDLAFISLGIEAGIAIPAGLASIGSSLSDTYGMFEVVATDGGNNYCFRPYDTIFSQDTSTPSYFPVTGVPGQNSCIYKVTHRSLEMDVTDELLVLDTPPNHGAPVGYIPYSCSSNECPGKCSNVGGAPLCQVRCDPGYAEVEVPDPNNPGNNIVTCLNCGDLKCDYTINCMKGGLLQSGKTVVAGNQFIGASCENQDFLTGCTDTSTAPNGHSVRQVGYNSCYATAGVGSTAPGTDSSLYGCKLQCHRATTTADCH